MADEFIYTSIEDIARDYKWTIDYIYSIDFYDFLHIYKRYKQRQESKAIADLRKLQMLTTAIHTGEPEEFIQQLEDAINRDSSTESVGDLQGLEKLKHKRSQYKKVGEIDGR